MRTTPEALERALKYCVDLAQLILRDSGEFQPFGAVATPEGEINALAGWDGEAHPHPSDLLALLTEELAEDASEGRIVGAALAVNVNMPAALGSAWPDGIRVRLEAAGFSRLIYVPYRLSRAGLLRWRRRVELGAACVVDAAPEIFIGSEG